MPLDALVIIAVGAVFLALPLSASHRSRRRRTLAARAGAEVPPDQAAALESRVTRQCLMTGAAIMLSGFAVLAVHRAWEGVEGNPFLIIFLAGAAGHALADILWPGAPDAGPRTARATAPSVADYVPPAVRFWARIMTACGLIAAVITLLLPRTGAYDRATLVTSAVALSAIGLIVVSLLTEWAAQRVLAAPQPARDEAELYWQDALRAQTLTQLTLMPPLVSVACFLVCANALWQAAWAASPPGTPAPTWPLWLSMALMAVPFLVALVAAVVTAARRGTWSEFCHVRDALWEGVAPQGHLPETGT